MSAVSDFFNKVGSAIKTGVQKVTKNLPSIASAVINGASNGGIMGAVSGGVKSIISAVTGVSKSEPHEGIQSSSSSSVSVSSVPVAVSTVRASGRLNDYALTTQFLKTGFFG